MEASSELATWLRAEIERRGWSISELARRLDRSQSLASDVLNGRTAPSADFALRAAVALEQNPQAMQPLQTGPRTGKEMPAGRTTSSCSSDSSTSAPCKVRAVAAVIRT